MASKVYALRYLCLLLHSNKENIGSKPKYLKFTMKNNSGTDELFKMLIAKGHLKQEVYSNTYNTFIKFKTIIKEIVKEYKESEFQQGKPIPFEYKNRGEFEVELKFAGDILVFMMHTNVFEFPRDHEVNKIPYVKEDKNRSYCGIINIYNYQK